MDGGTVNFKKYFIHNNISIILKDIDLNYNGHKKNFSCTLKKKQLDF